MNCLSGRRPCALRSAYEGRRLAARPATALSDLPSCRGGLFADQYLGSTHHAFRHRRAAHLREGQASVEQHGQLLAQLLGVTSPRVFGLPNEVGLASLDVTGNRLSVTRPPVARQPTASTACDAVVTTLAGIPTFLMYNAKIMLSSHVSHVRDAT